MIDLPWPGLSACAAPQKNAIAREANRTQPLGRCRISFAKPESPTARTATRCASACGLRSEGGGPAAAPGSTAALADVTSRGLSSRPFGYASRRSLALCEAAVERESAAPVLDET